MAPQYRWEKKLLTNNNNLINLERWFNSLFKQMETRFTVIDLNQHDLCCVYQAVASEAGRMFLSHVVSIFMQNFLMRWKCCSLNYSTE